MALISCPECGQQMSDKASACPHCGAPAAVGAAAEKKCEECGAVLPEGAAACPVCGCPVGERQAQSYQPQQSVQYGLPVQPARAAQQAQQAQLAQPARPAPNVSINQVRLGSDTGIKTMIAQKVHNSTAAVNTVGFITMLTSIVLYVIAFVKSMEIIKGLEDFKSANFLTSTITSDMTFFDDVNGLKIALIITLVFTGLVFIYKIFKASRSQVSSIDYLALIAMPIVGFWVSYSILWDSDPFFSESIYSFMGVEHVFNEFFGSDFGTHMFNDNFKIYMWVSPFVIVVLTIIDAIVQWAVICKETDFCPKCGQKSRKFGVKSICPVCKANTFLYGYAPISRDVVAAYPYSGETLMGLSPVRMVHAIGIVLVDICILGIGVFFFFAGLTDSNDDVPFYISVIGALIVAAAIAYTIFMCKKRGPSDKVTITPAGAELYCVEQKLNRRAAFADITDVLSDEMGHLAVCLNNGDCFIFKDLSDSARIAAALTSMSAKR